MSENHFRHSDNERFWKAFDLCIAELNYSINKGKSKLWFWVCILSVNCAKMTGIVQKKKECYQYEYESDEAVTNAGVF